LNLKCPMFNHNPSFVKMELNDQGCQFGSVMTFVVIFQNCVI
jgi:hypothetical protein